MAYFCNSNVIFSAKVIHLKMCTWHKPQIFFHQPCAFLSSVHASQETYISVLFLLTLCQAKWTLGSRDQQDWVHTGRRVSLRWPRPLSEAPGGSGSCKVAASTRSCCPAALRVAQPPPEYQSWKRAGGDWRSRRCCCCCWWPDPALEER